MQHNDLVRLKHIRDAAREALTFAAEETRETLARHRPMLLALVKEIEIIGEAVSRLSTEFRGQHPQIPWRDIIDMRNHLIHAYFNIDVDLVWGTIRDDLPSLLALVEPIIPQMELTNHFNALRSDSMAARLSAQHALADAGTPAIDKLLALLRDLSAPDEARWRAAMALGALAAHLPDDPRPADALVETFRRDPVIEVRDLITWTLGEARLPRLFEPLQEAYNALEDTDLIAYNSALAMARIDRPRALALFQADVNSPHEQVYRVALSALATLDS
jgi:uncharacterized protein with HEPN domain